MKRRTYLKTILAGTTAVAVPAAEAQKPIELHVDLSVDPSNESRRCFEISALCFDLLPANILAS